MFEAQTYDKVLEEILSRAPDGIDLRQGSIFYDAVAGIAFKIAKYYADLEQVFEMVFLVTATGDYLTLKAEEYAVYRQAAATAKYRIKYDGELPELGTRFFCSGQYFVLAQDDALGIYIEAEKAGTEANDIPAGTSVVPTDTQRSLTACSIVEELEPGADDEDDESLRKRVQEKIAGPAENGNQQHYKTWCESISAVRALFPFGRERTRSKVSSLTRRAARRLRLLCSAYRSTSTRAGPALVRDRPTSARTLPRHPPRRKGSTSLSP